MIVTKLRRPWEKTSRQGTRYNPDPRYQSGEWRRARTTHRGKSTHVTPAQWAIIKQINPKLTYTNGIISNEFCIDCYLEGILKPGSNTDHHNPVKAGADFWDQSNYRTLCDTHHARKSANEGKGH